MFNLRWKIPKAYSIFIAAISIWVFATEAKAEDWQFQVTPYLWAAGIEGDIATLPGLPEASIDLSFSDVIENFKIGGMLVAEARKGNNEQ